jgi:arabinogalactan endo-1,4-beta-galactosidase
MQHKMLLARGLSAMVVLALVLSLFVSTASAIYGEVEITPIESNIALKFWVASTADSGSALASLAHDDSLDTAWIADDRVPGHWFILDLGGQYDNLRKSEVVFSDRNAVYSYLIEASTDGSNWDVVTDRTDNSILAEGYVDLFTRAGTRYLRLTITGSTPGATIGIKEWRVFNFLRENIVNGADMSYVDQYRTRNYYLNPNPQMIDMGPGPNVLDVVKDRGMEFIRLRIWNQPRSENSGNPSTQPSSATPYIGPDRSALVATWIHERDLQLGIDFHYADSWADPGKQPKPRAWAELEFDDLVAAMHDFTYDYITRLVAQGTVPDKVAVGNEIINGFLWGSETLEMGLSTINPAYVRNNQAIYLSQPGGGLLWRYWGSTDPVEQQKYEEAWDRFSTLVAAGISAVREASPETIVEIHVINDKGRLAKTMEFWNQLLPRVNAKGANPDNLALSYYPEWHGTYFDLEEAFYTMASTFPQYKLDIAETAYPATGGSTPLPNADQPRTIQGQANMLKRTIQAANDIIDNRGTGVLVWEPQSFQPMFRSVQGMPNFYEPYASIDVYNKAFAKNVLEHNVYITTFEKTAPALPETVQMLTMSSGSIQPVPVVWDFVNPSQYDIPGHFTVNGVTDYGNVSATVTVIYDFGGFLPPVETLPAVNRSQSGSALPLKFGITGDHGLNFIVEGYPASQQVACDSGVILGDAEPTVAAESLTYDPVDDQYKYVWKAFKAWSGTCRQFILKLDDGTEYRASFMFE